MTNKHHPLTIWLLLAALLFLGFGGLYGGISMLRDPSGAALGVQTSMLAGLPVHDFVLPGLFLIVVMGILPLLLAYGLWANRPWSWTATAGLSVLLIGWIGFQILLWGMPIPIQTIMLLLGVFMLLLCLAPSSRAYAA